MLIVWQMNFFLIRWLLDKKDTKEYENDFGKKGKYLVILGKLIEHLHKKADKSECDIHRGISLVSLGNRFLSITIFFILRDAIVIKIIIMYLSPTLQNKG